MNYVVPVSLHDQLAQDAFASRGYNPDECQQAARFCNMAAWHGIKTHNLIKALHLDHLFGSGNTTSPGCVPNAVIDKKNSKFAAAQKWDANKKLGQAVAFEAIEACEKMADQYGVGIVSVDHAFHYLWGGGYVMESAKRGYIAYTNCTAALAEVVPFMGKAATLGTNPHSWGFPTTDAIGFPVVIDWATSTVAMGRVQQFKREGKQLPPNAAVDQNGNPTTDPNAVSALLPFGAHKGYGLSLINELVGGLIGGSLPTLRSRPENAGSGEKTTPNFFFQVIHPDALDCGAFACGRDQSSNIKAVIEDILGHGNEDCILPGQIEHRAAMESKKAQGLIFSKAQVMELADVASEVGVTLDIASFKTFR